jgi:type I site-specific restriction endonuclease
LDLRHSEKTPATQKGQQEDGDFVLWSSRVKEVGKLEAKEQGKEIGAFATGPGSK